MTENQLRFLGGMTNWLNNGKTLSRNYRTGERVYSTTGIAAAVTATGGGHAGCGGGLYLVRRKENV